MSELGEPNAAPMDKQDYDRLRAEAMGETKVARATA